MIDRDLRQRLLDMVRRDEAVRQRLAADGSLFDGYHPEMRLAHEVNAEALREIIDRDGWPIEAAAGPDGAEAAWRIAQHAIGRPDFQRFCLERLEEAAANGDVPKWQPAYLLDRIRTLEGRPQVYGTQFDWDEDGAMSPLPIEHADDVDARRAAVGLPPLADAIVRQCAEATREPKPGDLAARRARMEAWAQEVGWR